MAGSNWAAAASTTPRRVITAQRSAIDLGTHALINTDGQLSGTQQLVATTGRIDNTRGTLWSGSALALDTQGEALDNSAGVVHAEGDLSLKSSIFTNNGGRVHSATQTTIASQALDNDSGELIARTLELTTVSHATSRGGSRRASCSSRARAGTTAMASCWRRPTFG